MIEMAGKNKGSDNMEWLNDLEMENVDKSAKLDILPQLKINLNDIVIAKINTLPKMTLFADGNEYYTMMMEHDGIEKQFVAQAKSFRFQLAVLGKKLKGMENLVGKSVRITKHKVKMDKYPNAEVYEILLIE